MDVATGRPLGPPLEHGDWVNFVAFAPDGRTVLLGGERLARVWDAPAALPDDPPRLAAWIEAAVGLELDERGSIRVLDYSAWLEHRRYLEQLGGPPPADPAPRLDPILFGADPAARGDGWREREQWDRADAACAEAIRLRPLSPSAWDALARFHLARGRLDRAAATLAEAIQMMPDDFDLRRYLGATLLASGDRAGWRCLSAALLHRFGGTINPYTSNRVARPCVLGPEGTTDPETTVRLAEATLHVAGKSGNVDALATLGAALYRAGRYDDAIDRLEEVIQARGDQATAWAFLAMAHHRLGDREQALRWLKQLQRRQRSADWTQSWDELEVSLLCGEAEALILYDPAFPDGPFGD
jgi:tetratricopeptide (TPR) repeat protein